MKVVSTILMCAIVALTLNSCTSKQGINPFKETYQSHQTSARSMTYRGTMQGQYLDHDMIPILMCTTSQIVWATFPDSLYTKAVFLNQAVTKGTVEVEMIQVWSWSKWDFIFQIVSAHEVVHTPVSIAYPTTSGHAVSHGTRAIPRRTLGQVASRCIGIMPTVAPRPDIQVNITGDVNAPITIVLDRGNASVMPAPSYQMQEPQQQMPICDSIPRVNL